MWKEKYQLGGISIKGCGFLSLWEAGVVGRRCALLNVISAQYLSSDPIWCCQNNRLPGNRAKVPVAIRSQISPLRYNSPKLQVLAAQCNSQFVCEFKNYERPPNILWCFKRPSRFLTHCFKSLRIVFLFFHTPLQIPFSSGGLFARKWRWVASDI